jgi:hypothetical protein
MRCMRLECCHGYFNNPSQFKVDNREKQGVSSAMRFSKGKLSFILCDLNIYLFLREEDGSATYRTAPQIQA